MTIEPRPIHITSNSDGYTAISLPNEYLDVFAALIHEGACFIATRRDEYTKDQRMIAGSIFSIVMQKIA